MLFHVSLTCKLTHTSRVAHIAVKDKGSAVVFLCGSAGERKENEGETGRAAAAGGGGRWWWGWGWTEPAPVPHRRITLERTHHLCSFVELSHFNPRPGLLGTNFTPNPPPTHTHTAPSPTVEPPPQSISTATVSISTSVLL